jgi:hypothetical protein
MVGLRPLQSLCREFKVAESGRSGERLSAAGEESDRRAEAGTATLRGHRTAIGVDGVHPCLYRTRRYGTAAKRISPQLPICRAHLEALEIPAPHGSQIPAPKM